MNEPRSTIAIVAGRNVLETRSGATLVDLLRNNLAADGYLVDRWEDPLGPAVAFYVAWNADPVTIRNKSNAVFVFGAKAQTWVHYTVRPKCIVFSYADLGWLARQAKTRKYGNLWIRMAENLETELKKEYGNVRSEV